MLSEPESVSVFEPVDLLDSVGSVLGEYKSSISSEAFLPVIFSLTVLPFCLTASYPCCNPWLTAFPVVLITLGLLVTEVEPAAVAAPSNAL